MEGELLGLAGIVIRCSDPDKAIRPYRDGLGLPEIEGAVSGTWDVKEARSVIFPENFLITFLGGGEFSEHKTGMAHICLDTCNADDAWANFVRLGAYPSRESQVPTGDDFLYGGFLRCPGGEEVELWHIVHQQKKSEPYDGVHLTKAFAHVGIFVKDYDRSIEFYEKLGSRNKGRSGFNCSLQLRNKHEVELFPGGEEASHESGIVELIFAVDNAALMYQKALGLGAEPVRAPIMTQQGKLWQEQEPQQKAEAYGIIASVKAPNGEIISFVDHYSVESVVLFDD